MISFSHYAAVLKHAELRAAFAASVIGRLPIGITGLSILLLVQAATGSFATGGALTAAYVVGLASVAPLLGRVVDRTGPRRVLVSCALLFPAALGALVLGVRHAPDGVLNAALALAAGASFPPVTVCMRTFFRQRLGDASLLGAAYAIEAVLIEFIFIVGPMLVALLVGFVSPEAAVLLAATCAATGTLLFIRSPVLTHWRIERLARTSLLGPLAEPGFAGLLVVVLGYATAFGLVEIGVTAYASAKGQPALAGILLALMSAASAMGGLAYGGRIWGLPLPRQFAVALALMGIGIAPLAIATDVWIFALLCFGAGLVMAPALTIQSLLVSAIASPRHATEAFTWSSSGLLSGVGLGMVLGGWLIETASAGAAFAFAAISALSAGALATRLGRRT